MREKCVRAFLGIFVALVSTGCGGTDSGIVTKQPQFKAVAPETPGSIESLQESPWEYRGAYYQFKPNGELIVEVFGQGQPAEYTFDQGVVTLTLEDGTILHGTWDGVDLVIEGRSATRVEPQ
ncbi:MAG: hypothetical protein IT365_15030 [Candidatus Hydrogenedentes bacterium]|nr:hypothetical protein [Candidatus Hydrogenedentota bacterium]